MNRLAVVAVISLGVSFSAQAENLQCNFESDYTFSQQGRTLIFSRDSGPGKRIMIQDGRMVIDGKEISLGVEDKRRVTEFENETRLLIPQVQQVSHEAVDIAFNTMIEVSRALNGDADNQTVKKLEGARIALHQSLGKDPMFVMNGDFDGKIIEPIVTDFVPDVVSAALKQALSLAFSGDDKKAKEFEARMDNLDKNIKATVEVRAKRLEPLANAMCSRLQGMDKIEDSISVRLSNKEKINLFNTKAP